MYEGTPTLDNINEKQETKSDKWYCDACESTFKKPANPLTRIVRNILGMKKHG